MRLGVSRCDISPPAGVDLTGFIARDGPCTGVHDPLFATALVAEDRGNRVALVSCDLIGLGAALVRRLRATVERQTGIPAPAQMYVCTHTHAGPETGVLPSIADADPGYLQQLERQLVDAVAGAAARAAPVRLGWARGACHAAFNRVLARAGQDDRQIDPDVIVVRIETADGEALAAIVHYTCHPVAAGAANRLASADWCGVVRQQLEALGSGPVLVVNGAGGDINPRLDQSGFAAVEQVGKAVAAVAQELWAGATGQEVQEVRAQQAVVPLVAFPPGGAEEIAQAWAKWRDTAQREAPGSLRYREAAVIYRDYARRLMRYHWGSDPRPLYTGETQAIRIGPLAVVALPGEFFAAYGRAIKQRSPAPATIVAGWANDNLGYFPTAESFPIGGYEMDTAARYYGMAAPWTPEAGAAVSARASTLTQRLYAANTPGE